MENPCLSCIKMKCGYAYGCKELIQYHHINATEYAQKLTDVELEEAIKHFEAYLGRVFLSPIIEENRIYLEHLKMERASRRVLDHVC